MTASLKKRFFDREENVKRYIEMRDGIDGGHLIKKLRQHLPLKSKVLELGLGPGNDLDILRRYYDVVGSDISAAFLEHYRTRNPGVELIELDATSLETKHTFDCIYSNKVLHHLKREELRTSFERQNELLNSGGIIFHSFWLGAGENEFQDLSFIRYNLDEILKTSKKYFTPIEASRYAEMNLEDSVYVILRKNHE